MTFTRRWRPRNHVGHLRRHGNAARKFPRWPEKDTRGDREDGGNFLEGGVRGSFEDGGTSSRGGSVAAGLSSLPGVSRGGTAGICCTALEVDTDAIW